MLNQAETELSEYLASFAPKLVLAPLLRGSSPLIMGMAMKLAAEKEHYHSSIVPIFGQGREYGYLEGHKVGWAEYKQQNYQPIFASGYKQGAMDTITGDKWILNDATTQSIISAGSKEDLMDKFPADLNSDRYERLKPGYWKQENMLYGTRGKEPGFILSDENINIINVDRIRNRLTGKHKSIKDTDENGRPRITGNNVEKDENGKDGIYPDIMLSIDDVMDKLIPPPKVAKVFKKEEI